MRGVKARLAQGRNGLPARARSARAACVFMAYHAKITINYALSVAKRLVPSGTSPQNDLFLAGVEPAAF